MSLTISYVPGYTLAPGELATNDKINAIGKPTINLSGSIGSLVIADGSVTTVKLADGALAASSTGRGKMAAGFISADATGRAFFAAGFFGANDATSEALFATGFFSGDAATQAMFADAFLAPIAPVIASARNYTSQNNGSGIVSATADEVILKNSSGRPVLLSGVSISSINIASTGANGLDVGSGVASTWYYVWLIYNGTTVSGLLSASSTAPTLPGGYTFKALMGAVYYTGSTFTTYYQHDRDVYIDDAVIFTGANGIITWSATSGPALTAMQATVPPIAKMAWGSAGNTTNNGGVAIAADASALGAVVACNGTAAGVSTLSFQLGGNWRVPLKTAQTFYYIMANTSTGYRVTVSGYRI